AKLHARLELKIQNKTFYRLSLRKRNELVGKVRKCYVQLSKAGISLKKTALAGSMALALVLGSTANAQFVEQMGMANPFNNINTGDVLVPVFADIDGDGDLDMVTKFDDSNTYLTTYKYFENTGTSSSPNFVEQMGANNPFGGFSFGSTASMQTESKNISLVDIDGDGDLDIFFGGTYEDVTYYENTGSVTSPIFTQRTGAANPFDGETFGYGQVVTFADMDGDGDVDAFIGDYYGNIFYYENTGTASSSTFTQRTGTANPLDAVSFYQYSAVAIVDLDQDGDIDCYAGGVNTGYSIAVEYYLNTGTPTSPTLVRQTPANDPLDGLNVGDSGFPFFVDLDGDGDQDVCFTQLDGTTKYFRNDASAMSIFGAQNNDTNDHLSDFYPNPSQQSFVNLNYTAEEIGLIEVSVFDRAGKLLNTQTRQVLLGKNQLSFDFSTLSTGLYLVRFEEADKAAFRKLVIE
ncbi:MAG: T9SS type A sorting domain-containing protein, partial [Bacteroidota bacterium]